MNPKLFFLITFILKIEAFALNFSGEILFRNDLSAPGFSLEAKCSEFEQFEFTWIEEKKTIAIKNLKASLKTICLKKGLSLQNKYVDGQKIDLASLKIKTNDGIITLSSKLIPCIIKQKNIYICSGQADILLEDKKSLVPVTMSIEKQAQKLTGKSSFNLSLKKMGVTVPNYMGMEAQDKVSVQLNVSELKSAKEKI